jgi:hypothetical protein
MSPVEIVQRQLDAYNAHDLAAFVALFSDNITVFRMPSAMPTLSGKAAFTQFYATQRFNVPALRADLVNRMVLGHHVVDHELIHGLSERPLEIAVVYEVGPASIQRSWSFAAA